MTVTSQSEYGGKCVCRPVCRPVFWFLVLSVIPSSPPPGRPSDGHLTSLAVDTDSLAELDDGMASGRTSPNQPPPPGGATLSSSPLLPSLRDRLRGPALVSAPVPVPTPVPEVSRPARAQLFPGSLKRASANAKDVKPDYLDRASERIRLAVQKEEEQDYQAAFSCYRSGVDLLLQGVQGRRVVEVSLSRSLALALSRSLSCSLSLALSSSL